MKCLILLAALCCVVSVKATPALEDVQAEIANADPRYVLSRSSHHVPEDDPLVSVFVDILHDGDEETVPEPQNPTREELLERVKEEVRQLMQKRSGVPVAEVVPAKEEASVDDEFDPEFDDRIGKLVNVYVAVDNRGNGNGDGLVNVVT